MTHVIVAGSVYIDPAEIDRHVEGFRELVEQGRAAPGCLDFSISADPFEPGRVNLFEYWESQESLDAWRARAPHPAVTATPLKVEVLKHDIARSGPPFD